MTRDFTLGQVLSVTTGVLLCPIGDVYEILNFMTGEILFTHQLPRVSREAGPVLLHQYPLLATVDASGVNADNWKGWLAIQAERFGETLPVAPMTEDDHERIDPVSELAEKIHPDRIIAVRTDRE